ncbi:MAG: hypothetical protein KIT39_05130 [Nitrospirales bacterium]|nr:hypothetical protein [Nitrospirales bacterium]
MMTLNLVKEFKEHLMKRDSFIIEGEKPVFISLSVSLGFVFLSIIGLWALPGIMLLISQ